MTDVAAEPNPRRWLILAVVGTAFFMTILDVAIVNVAIPSIEIDLTITRQTVEWVIIAYSITFGGFLLLGGRMADLLGRRRIFVAGVILFTLASLACGLSKSANSAGLLIAARSVQGLGAAIISPAALSIVITTFTEGSERNKALGIWGALGGSGAAAGVLFGGIIVKYLGWEWIFFVNIPVGALVLAATPRIIPESRLDVAQRRFDVPGALTVTGGLALLVYAISKAPDVGWGSARTIVLLIGSVIVLAAFVVIELRESAPLMPFSIFRNRSLTAANVVALLMGMVIFANFFVLTLYVQQVLGWSPLRTGVTFLATAGTTVLWAGVAQALTTRFSARPVIVAGLLTLAVALYLYTRIAGVAQPQAGLASGLLNTTQQIGGAIGVAIVTTIFTSRFKSAFNGHNPLQAATSGYQWAFWALFALALAGAIAAFILLRGVRPAEATEPEPVDVPV